MYTPEQWIMLIKMAKISGEPYEVIEVKQDMVFDLKQLVGNDRNWKTDENGKNVKWNDIREIKIFCDEPHKIHIKYDFVNENEKCILDLNKINTKRVKVKPIANKNLSKAYKNPIPISKKNLITFNFFAKMEYQKCTTTFLKTFLIQL